MLFEDTGAAALSSTYFRLRMTWETDYDAGKMRLQLLRRRVGTVDELLWAQTDVGLRYRRLALVPSGLRTPRRSWQVID